MAFEQIVTNFSTIIRNTDSGQQLVYTPQTSDVKIIADLCIQYYFFTITFCSIAILLLFAKVYLRRLTNKAPTKEKKMALEKIYYHVDEICDNALLFMTVIILLVSLSHYFL